MTSLRSSLRAWWRWRRRQGRVAWFGEIESRIGTLIALDRGTWSVEDAEGRMLYVRPSQSALVAGLHVGDRVEVAPSVRGGFPWPRDWAIRRKMGRSE